MLEKLVLNKYQAGLSWWFSGKESTCNAASLAGGHGNPFQYSCLENPMDRGAWRATVHRFTKGQTQLKLFSMYTRMYVSGLLPC